MEHRAEPSSSGGIPDTWMLFHNDGASFTLANAFDAVSDIDYEFTDVSGDGVTDVVLSSGDAPQILVMLGKGDATFEKDALMITGPWTSSAFPVFRDVNGDNKSDLVVSGPTVSVLLRE